MDANTQTLVFTAEEEAEFTFFNFVAFDLIRVDAIASGTVPPMWLCTSAEAKLAAQRRALEFVNHHAHNLIPVAMEAAPEYFHTMFSLPLMKAMANWKEFELDMKRIREVDHNPRAFFAG